MKTLNDTGVLVEEKTTREKIVYRFLNDKDPKIVDRLALTPSIEVLYMECNGRTNRKYSMGESLDASDIQEFVDAVRFSIPTIEKAGALRKETWKFEGLTLNKSIGI